MSMEQQKLDNFVMDVLVPEGFQMSVANLSLKSLRELSRIVKDLIKEEEEQEK